MKKRSDGRYAKQVTVGIKNGKPVKKTVYGKTIKEVEKKYRELMMQLDKGICLDANNVTVDELWDEWFRIKKNNVITEATKMGYQATKNIISPCIGNVKVKNVKVYAIESILSDVLSRGHVAQAALLLSHCKALFNYAVAADIVYKNPCADLSVKYKPPIKRCLTALEKLKIEKAHLSLRDKAFVYILRYTGMRRGEVFALQKSDLDFNNFTITVTKTLSNTSHGAIIRNHPKTDAGIRIIPIFTPLILPLMDYVNTLPDNSTLFLNRRGNLMEPASVTLYIKRLRKIIGLPDDVTCHTFRHTFVSDCYAAGVDLKLTQAWVGHDDDDVTRNVYTHISKDRLTDGKIMNNFYAGNQKSKRSQADFLAFATL